MPSDACFHYIIGLGHRCHTANSLRRCMIHEQTMPFDWVISDVLGVADAIRSRFHGMLEPGNLTLNEKMIFDSQFRFEHWHDYPIEPAFMLHHDRVWQRRAALVARFFQALSATKRILFVRHEQSGHGSLIGAQAIVSAIAQYRPEASFRLLYLADNLPFSESDNLTVLPFSSEEEPSLEDWISALDYVHSNENISGFHPAAVRFLDALPSRIGRPIVLFIGSFRKRLRARKLFLAK